MVEAIGDMPEGVLYSRVPSGDDLDEAAIRARAWAALAAAHPEAEAQREWYEDACALMFGAKDGEGLAWYALFMPNYTFPSNRHNTTPQPDIFYTVRLDRAGNVAGITARETVAIVRSLYIDESMNPLDVYALHLHAMLWAGTPYIDMTDDARMDYNIWHLLPHMRGESELTKYGPIRGIPGPGHIPREEAVAAARQALAQADAGRAEATFLTGDNSDGALRPAEDYPLWYVALWDRQGESTIGYAYISATTGEVMPE